MYSGRMTADPLVATVPARTIPADERPWPWLDRRTVELTLTSATLLLIVASALAGRLAVPTVVTRAIDVAAYVTGGWFAVGGTVPRLLRGQFDVDFLMLLAAGGAAFTGSWHEGAILLFLFSLSNTLQTYAMDRSRRAISRLLQGRPRHATVPAKRPRGAAAPRVTGDRRCDAAAPGRDGADRRRHSPGPDRDERGKHHRRIDTRGEGPRLAPPMPAR